MGWINYIVIPDWKIAIEVSRGVNELEIGLKNAIQKAIEFDCDKFEIMEKGIMQVDVGDLKVMAEALDIVHWFGDADPAMFVLFWLEGRKIEYMIKSEYDFDPKKEGYKVVKW